MKRWVGWFVVGVISCGGTEVDNTGTLGAACFANRTCHDGLVCADSRCVEGDDDEAETVEGSRDVGGSGRGGGSGTGGRVVSAGSGGAPSTGGVGIGIGGFGTGGSGVIDECGGVSITARVAPAGLYLMVDQSSSMGDPLASGTGTKWEGLVAGIGRFVATQSTNHVGIQYFGLPDRCNPDVYAVPEVPLGPASSVGPAIIDSLAMHGPSTLTPTGPALLGAITHMKEWAQNHPDYRAAVVLVTDGFPSTCGGNSTTGEPDLQSLSVIEGIARDAFQSDPPVLTLVIGIQEGKSNGDAIARAGGTGEAAFIESGDIADQVEQALARATGQLPCEILLPPPPEGEIVDVDRVSLAMTSNSTGVRQQIPRVSHLGECALNGGEGWYYDHPAAPSMLVLCPGTCARASDGRLDVTYGCPPLSVPD